MSEPSSDWASIAMGLRNGNVRPQRVYLEITKLIKTSDSMPSVGCQGHHDVFLMPNANRVPQSLGPLSIFGTGQRPLTRRFVCS